MPSAQRNELPVNNDRIETLGGIIQALGISHGGSREIALEIGGLVEGKPFQRSPGERIAQLIEVVIDRCRVVGEKLPEKGLATDKLAGRET